VIRAKVEVGQLRRVDSFSSRWYNTYYVILKKLSSGHRDSMWLVAVGRKTEKWWESAMIEDQLVSDANP
jgi:hypothetical protein